MNIVIKIIDVNNDKYIMENHLVNLKWNLLNLGKMMSDDFKLSNQIWIFNNKTLPWYWNQWEKNMELVLFIENIWFSITPTGI